MKKISLFFVFFLIFILNSHSQEMPSWVKYGMSINEIKIMLGVDSYNISDGTNNEIGKGFWGGLRPGGRENLYVYITQNDFSYNFEIDPQIGLISLQINGNYNVKKLVGSISNKYGYSLFDGDSYYWTREAGSNLPRYLEHIMIFASWGENYANLFYILRQ